MIKSPLGFDGPALSPEEIESRYKANPDSLEEPDILAALRKMSEVKRVNLFKKLDIKGDLKAAINALLFPQKETIEAPTVEDAIRALAGSDEDQAREANGVGFSKYDWTKHGDIIKKVQSGKALTFEDKKTALKTIVKRHGKQLKELHGINWKDIEIDEKEPTVEHSSPETIAAAREILQREDPIEAHLGYVKGKIHGGEKPARAVLLSSYSAYLPADDRLHADAVGSSQSGKSATVTTVLETFPEENVIVTSEASPKSLYYLAQENPERLKDTIVYIDDARPEHIPVLKTFRNEGNVTPRNLTVSDGEVLELIVKYRPVVLASSVTPLRDMEQQATSRTFLISIPDATKEEEKKVRTAIRRQARAGAILSQKTDERLEILRALARMLRDEGIRDVLVPFDAEEPDGADRRGTGQFQRLIKISAFINQFQRPILELMDGRKFVLAIREDLRTAATVWFDFAEGQEFKITSKAQEVLNALPSSWPGKSAPTLESEMKIGQRSIERYLEDLYEAGIASRERITAPGMPWGYWSEKESRQKALSQISEAGEDGSNNDRIATKNLCRKYLGEKSSDLLKNSIQQFFTNNDIINKEMYREIKVDGEVIDGENPAEIYLTLFSLKSCRDSHREPDDSEYLRQSEMSESVVNPSDSGSENVAIPVGNTPARGSLADLRAKAEGKEIKWTEDEPAKKLVVVRFLQDRPPYKKNDVASFRGCLIVRDPPVVREISCGQCPTAIKGSPPVCPECYYLKRAEAVT